MVFTESIDKLITEFLKLPGIGKKTATSLAFAVLKLDKNDAFSFSDAIKDVKNKVKLCKSCYNISEDELCVICKNTLRDKKTLCVVETPQDLFSIESSKSFSGLYHVLHGHLAPIEGVGPDELKIQELLDRVISSDISEVILATNPNIEGEATATYIAGLLKGKALKITKLALGLPSGAHLEYADPRTLLVSMNKRDLI